ncbi:SDR family oxidoreductase [Blastopirellula sp. JC732]|uniref:SDR family oxidoreductase n=1 Tax=Blastopirellula sediminis TaxID=2894196 RepID=A0A9X1MQR7_9BACT|nr:SDR family oxidoreductase [Blastopirellula sediminis]MCC9605539.1 SDR family oxidoreductase [Blastopirellula sediminis]MCC9631161.1 SDR family oxidoreductase [Blastopirellula sediminis]
MTTRNPFSLQDRTVLLTGASGYLGSAMAIGLAEAGASVVVSSRNLEQATSIAANLPIVGNAKHHAVAIDHQEAASLEQGFQQAIQLAGQIDTLIANGHEPLAADWTSVTPEQFTRQLQNATGYFLMARLLHEHVVARDGEGSVIFLGSMYGVVGSYPDAYAGVNSASPVAYHALKGGVVQMTRHLAVYWAKDKVRVNCLSPGPFPSEKAAPEMVERLCSHSPMGRMGRPEELVGPLVFLASDAASYVTGQNLLVDGGWTAW